MLAGTAQLTCASLRCRFHEAPVLEEELDPESTEPLVPTKLKTFELPFNCRFVPRKSKRCAAHSLNAMTSDTEEAEKKSALVKVVLCRNCGKKLLHGREKGKDKGREAGGASFPDGGSREQGSEVRERGVDDDSEYLPDLPPEMMEERRRRSSHGSTSRRRSASPRRR